MTAKRLSHRGIHVSISTEGIEQNLWMWKERVRNTATWDAEAQADRVTGHIAVVEGQTLRVNIESDGSMGAIATSICVDGIGIGGPYLKGKGTAWIDGVPALGPKSGAMSGRFRIEKMNDGAGAAVMPSKYRGAFGVMVRFLGPYMSSPGDEDDDVEVMDRVDFPDTMRGNSESSLRVGLDGEREGARKYPTYTIPTAQCDLPPVEFLFKYNTSDYLKNDFKYMGVMKMEFAHKRPVEVKRAATWQKRKASEAALDVVALTPEVPTKKSKGKRRRGEESVQAPPNKRQTRALSEKARAKGALNVSATPSVQAESSGITPAGGSSTPSVALTLEEEPMIWNPPIVPSHGPRERALMAEDAAAMQTNAIPQLNSPHVSTTTRNVRTPVSAMQSSATLVRRTGSATHARAHSFEHLSGGFSATARRSQDVAFPDAPCQNSAPIYPLDLSLAPRQSIQDISNLIDARFPQAELDPSHYMQSNISGVVRNDTETIQLNTGDNALLHGQQSHTRPMYQSQAAAPACDDHLSANSAAPPTHAWFSGASGQSDEALNARYLQPGHAHPAQRLPMAALPLAPVYHRNSSGQSHAQAEAGPSFIAPAHDQCAAIALAYLQSDMPPVQTSQATSSNDLPDWLAALEGPESEEFNSQLRAAFGVDP